MRTLMLKDGLGQSEEGAEEEAEEEEENSICRLIIKDCLCRCGGGLVEMFAPEFFLGSQ